MSLWRRMSEWKDYEGSEPGGMVDLATFEFGRVWNRITGRAVCTIV
jgi:hypothetical protein